jgi:hypothetical protein
MAKFIDSGILFGIARRAANSIETPPREGGKFDALTSVVFSVLTVEAFLNEVTELAADSRHSALEPESVIAFARLMDDLERSRASLLSRLALSHWLLTGKSVDRSSSPFQDFASLVGLRNDLVHFKPNEDFDTEMRSVNPETIHENRLKRLRSQNILADFSAGKTSWTFYVATKAVADWSCRIASDTLLDFGAKVPDSLWGRTVQFLVKDAFNLKRVIAEEKK